MSKRSYRARRPSPSPSSSVPHPLSAEGPYRNRDNKDPKDLSEGTYPIPYQKPTVAEITEVLERVRGYLDATSPTQVVDGRTGGEITDFSVPNVEARIPDGAGEAFYPLDYTMGVTHSGMLLATEVTGRRAVRRVHAPAAPVRRRPPPVLPRGGREGRAAGEGDVRGHHRDRLPRRLGVHVRRPREGAPGRGRARPQGRSSTTGATTSRTSSSVSPTAPSRASARSPSRCGPTTST